MKCEEHTHPDLRECATKAKGSLLKGLEGQGADGDRKDATACIGKALEGVAAPDVDAETKTYAARFVSFCSLTVCPY